MVQKSFDHCLNENRDTIYRDLNKDKINKFILTKFILRYWNSKLLYLTEFTHLFIKDF